MAHKGTLSTIRTPPGKELLARAESGVVNEDCERFLGLIVSN